MNKYQNKAQAGFTLVEMLVVIAIIGILAAITIPTIFIVIDKAKENRIAQELDQLSQAVEAYKQKYGSYPPDFTNVSDLASHISFAFKNHQDTFVNTNMTNPDGTPVINPTTSAAALIADLDASEALVFWLAMVKNDVRKPFNGQGERAVLFPFDENRLIDPDQDGWLSYVPKVSSDYNAPFVYFCGRTYNATGASGPLAAFVFDSNINDVARPYQTDKPRTGPVANQAPDMQWAGKDKFQIISAGLDNEFGEDTSLRKLFPSGTSFLKGDYDNISNFSEGKTFEDHIE